MQLKREFDKYGLGINGTYYAFDLVSSFSVSDTSTLSEFPLVTKTLVVDHKFNEPRKITISGSVSNSSNFSNFPFYDENESKITFKDNVLNNFIQNKLLTKTYLFLKDLKNKNVFVKLFTPNLIIDNCLITDFTWTENGEWADFNLSLSEVKTFVFEHIKIAKVEPDPSLPNLNDAVPQSAIETLLLKDRTETDLLIIKALQSKELITNGFMKSAAVVGLSVVGIGVAAAIAVFAVLCASNPVGWVLGALVAIGGCLYFIGKAIAGWIKKLKRRKKYIKEFESYQNEKKMKKEVERYSTVVNDIYEQIKVLNKVIFAYSITSNINQDILLTLNNEFYTIKFKKDQQNGAWKWAVMNQNEELIQSWKELEVFKSFYKCDNDNFAFKNGNDRVYFVYDIKSLDKDNNDTFLKGNIDITKMTIVVTNFNLDTLKDTIAKVTIEGMKKK